SISVIALESQSNDSIKINKEVNDFKTNRTIGRLQSKNVIFNFGQGKNGPSLKFRR
ncbi:1219_t:CDS:1, partial [Entrophospora sp. SA101]